MKCVTMGKRTVYATKTLDGHLTIMGNISGIRKQ